MSLRYINNLDSYEHYYLLSKAKSIEMYNTDLDLYNKIKEAKVKIFNIAPVDLYKEYNRRIDNGGFKYLDTPHIDFIKELIRFIKSEDYVFRAGKTENSSNSNIYDENYNEEEGDNEMSSIETYLENKEDSKETVNKNKNLFDKKFIITQDGISLPLYFKKDWDYEVLDAGADGQHSITITVSPDKQTKTIVIGRYFSTEVNAVLQDLVTFIYSEKEYVFQMPINDTARDEDFIEDTSKELKDMLGCKNAVNVQPKEEPVF